MPEYDDNVSAMWELYIKLNKGSHELSYADIVAFQSLTDMRLTPWEVDLMLDIDIMRRKDG